MSKALASPLPLQADSPTNAESWFWNIWAQLTTTNVAFFALLSILTLHLVEQLRFTAGETALVLAMATTGLRFARVLVAPVADKLAPRIAIPAAILLSMGGYIGLAYATTPAAVATSVLFVGLGYGSNGLIVTTLASYAKHGTAFSRFTMMNIGTNVAAAIGPVISNHLRLTVDPSAPFLFAAAMLATSLVVALVMPAGVPCIRSQHGWWHTARLLMRNPRYLAALACISLGWFLYTQKFAVLPLFVSQTLGHPEWVGAMVALNAVWILAFSFTVSRWLARKGVSTRRVMLSALAIYMAAYALVSFFPSVTTAWVLVIMAATAEGLLMPALNSIVSDVTGSESRLTAYSLAAVAIGVGEGAGNILGVLLFKSFAGGAYVALTLAGGVALLAMALLTRTLFHPPPSTRG